MTRDQWILFVLELLGLGVVVFVLVGVIYYLLH